MQTAADKVTRSTATTNHLARKLAFFQRSADNGSAFFARPSYTAGAAPFLQAKLSVSKPDDPHEKEADRMADHVMRMPEPVVTAAPADSAPPGGAAPHGAATPPAGSAAKPEDDALHRQAESHEEVQPKLDAPAP